MFLYKMKNFKIIILAIAIMFAAVSCGSGNAVDTALSQVEKVMEKVEKNKTSMTEADWEAMSKELEQPLQVLQKALESNNVSWSKKMKISAMMLRYTAVATEAALNTAANESGLTVDSISSLSKYMPNPTRVDNINAINNNVQIKYLSICFLNRHRFIISG